MRTLLRRNFAQSTTRWSSVLLDDELTRQADLLVGLGYPDQVRSGASLLLDPLRARLGDDVTSEPARASFVLVPGATQLPVSERVPLLRLGDRRGTLSRHFSDVDGFEPVVEVPDAVVYAVVGVERGEEFCDVRPAEAAVTIAARGRTMLTMEEGLALLHAVPSALEKNRCFHTGGSAARTGGCPRSGSRTGRRTWAGAGSRTTTPGWVSPRPRNASHLLPAEVTRR